MSDRIMDAIANAPKQGQLVRHIDGGIYRFVGLSQHTDDQSLMYNYHHIWPFEQSVIPWARPSDQWGSRFVPITEQDLEEAMRQDRAQAQQAVLEAKAARRAAGASLPMSSSGSPSPRLYGDGQSYNTVVMAESGSGMSLHITEQRGKQ